MRAGVRRLAAGVAVRDEGGIFADGGMSGKERSKSSLQFDRATDVWRFRGTRRVRVANETAMAGRDIVEGETVNG